MKRYSAGMAAFFCCLFIALSACSTPPAPINVDAEGIALKGYDPVAYFTLGRPVKGRNEYQHEWHNAKWLFSSEQHLAMFRETPEKFAPQYGGY